MGPIIPYLSDSPAQLEAAVRQTADAGAAHITPIVLHLRPGAREWFLGWLRDAHPALVPRYAELYGRGAYRPAEYRSRISPRSVSWPSATGSAAAICWPSRGRGGDAGRGGGAPPQSPQTPSRPRARRRRATATSGRARATALFRLVNPDPNSKGARSQP